jgi:hypothetical protein
MGDYFNLYCDAMGLELRDLVNGLPKGHVWADLFPPVQIPMEILQRLRYKQIVRLSKGNEDRLSAWTGMDADELYLNR